MALLKHTRAGLIVWVAGLTGFAGCGGDSSSNGSPDSGTPVDCSTYDCGAGTCDDSTGSVQCECDARFVVGAGGACDTCEAGYAGSACDECAPGYVPSLVVPDACNVGLAVHEGLALWVDAEEYDSFTISTNDSVMVWADRVSGTLTLSSLDLAYRPIYQATAINGKPGVQFDGVNDYLGISNFDALDGEEGYSIFIVGYSAVDDHGVFLAGVNGSGDYGLWITSEQQNQLEFGHDGTFAVDPDVLRTTGGNASRTSAQVMSFIRTSAPAHRIRIGGSEESLSTPSAADFNAGLVAMNMGGREGATGTNLNGTIGEVLIFAPALAPSDITEVEAYLRAKWGI
jgi:hypothetical protein